MPLNCAKLPSAWRKKRSIGIIRSIALFERRRRLQIARREQLAQRQQVGEQLDQRAGLRLMWPPSGKI